VTAQLKEGRAKRKITVKGKTIYKRIFNNFLSNLSMSFTVVIFYALFKYIFISSYEVH